MDPKGGLMPVEEVVSQEEVQPWYRLGGVEHVCELRKDATVLYAIFINILRTIYMSKEGRTFGCPDVLWTPDSQKTGIWIDTELRWEDKRPDFLPAIYVCLGQIQYEEIGLMSRSVIGGANRYGETPHQVKASGVANLVHVSNTAGSACSLADNTDLFMSHLRTELARAYCFTGDLAVVSRTPLQKNQTPEQDGKKRYSSIVTVGFSFQESWMVKQESPILKDVYVVATEHGEKATPGKNIVVADGHDIIEYGNIDVTCDT